jgi:SAM-dependent methyltransferase
MTSRWNHNLHYHRVILEVLPSHCRRVLDVGCGEGALARQLRTIAPEVTAIDLDPASIDLARHHDHRVPGDGGGPQSDFETESSAGESSRSSPVWTQRAAQLLQPLAWTDLLTSEDGRCRRLSDRITSVPEPDSGQPRSIEALRTRRGIRFGSWLEGAAAGVARLGLGVASVTVAASSLGRSWGELVVFE